MMREDDSCACDLWHCREYQADECKLNDSLRFFLIPSIPSIHAFELPTTSWYSPTALAKDCHCSSAPTLRPWCAR